MKKYLKLFLFSSILILVLFVIIKCGGGDSGNNPVQPVPSTTSSNLEIPVSGSTGQIVKHTAYSLQYNEANEQPEWVAYFLTQNRLNGGFERQDDFRIDPDITSGSAQLDDYRSTGYDRGHMAPAGDFTWSQTAMSESFFLSNMSPQVHAFNAGIWEELESQVRTWANVSGDTLFITVGPILRSGLPTIGTRNKLTVPEYYYKALLRKTSAGYDAIAFLMKHENSSLPLSSFAITVDSLEKVTNINFFSKLPLATQSSVEASINLSKWPNIMQKNGVIRKRLATK